MTPPDIAGEWEVDLTISEKTEKQNTMRTKNSCRFAPYYKVEKWNDSTQCWTPIQKSFPTVELAQKMASHFKKSRIIRRSENGTEVLL